MHLNVVADEAGEITLKVSSPDYSAKVKVEVDGDAEIEATRNVNIKSYNEFKVTVIDPTDESKVSILKQTETNHDFRNDEQAIDRGKFTINAGEEPLVLEKKWPAFMKNFIAEVGRSTVTTDMGEMPLLNAEQINAY